MSHSDGIVSCLATRVAEPVQWLWAGRVAAGKLTLIDGDPHEGKSLLTLDLAARLSTGQPLPESQQAADTSAVILLNAEDGVEDTVVPRLHAAGADLSRIHIFEGRRTAGSSWR